MRHVRRFSFQYYDFVRQCHAFDLAWRHFDHLPLLKFAHFAHFPNLSLDTPASLESSSSVWIGSAFSEICKSWGLIPPVDVACFSFAFAWITFFIFKANSEHALFFATRPILGIFIPLVISISVSSSTRSRAFCWPLDYQSALDYLKLR